MTSTTNLMDLLRTINFTTAKLMSRLSDRPARVQDDIFVWGDHIIDRATAIVMLIKLNNNIPLTNKTKVQLHQQYLQRFAELKGKERWLRVAHSDPEVAGKIWFARMLIDIKRIRGDEYQYSSEEVRQILVDLHQS